MRCLLLSNGPGPTLRWIANVLLERAALRIINVLTEGDPKKLNLESMRAFLKTKCHPDLRAQLTAAVDPVFVECELGTVRKRAERHRHNLLAHHNAAHFTRAEVRKQSLISLRELEELLDKAKRMLDALTVHTGLGYDVHRLSEDDSMTFIVDALLRTSDWLNMPEEQGMMVFNAFAAEFTPEQRQIYKTWRERFGLPPVQLPPVK